MMIGIIFLFLILILGSLTAFAFFSKSLPDENQKLTPFAVLPVPDSSPSVKAFLEFYASQIAWMDSEILYTVLLIYPENAPDVQQLCEEISRQHDFFTPLSLPQAQQLLEFRLKNSEIFLTAI